MCTTGSLLHALSFVIKALYDQNVIFIKYTDKEY